MKVIVSAPGAASASAIAWRKDPAPLSFKFDTVKVAAWARVTPLAHNANASKARTTIDFFLSAFCIYLPSWPEVIMGNFMKI
jgi:hypothetical protein